jgi:hypothetical protein
VLIFNWLSGRIANYEAGLLNSGSELVDRLELEARAQAHAAAAAAPVAAPAPAAAPAVPSERPGIPSRPVPRTAPYSR